MSTGSQISDEGIGTKGENALPRSLKGPAEPEDAQAASAPSTAALVLRGTKEEEDRKADEAFADYLRSIVDPNSGSIKLRRIEGPMGATEVAITIPSRDESAALPEMILNSMAPHEAQKIAPMFGPLAPGQNQRGGLYRKFRNYEMGHLLESTRDEAVKMANEAAQRELQERLADPLQRNKLAIEHAKEDELAAKHGVELTKISKIRVKQNDPASDEFLGPWAPYEGEMERRQQLLAMAADINEQQAAATEKILEKPTAPPAAPAPSVSFHTEELTDYQGRKWIDRSMASGPRVMPGDPDAPSNYQLPKKCVHTFSGHTQGINRIRWFPESAHLLLSCAMDNNIKIWSVDGGPRRCIATYTGHGRGVKDVNFTSDGLKFYSASFDRTIRLWDTEYGKVITSFGNDKVPFCVSVHPDPNKQNVVVCACQNKRAVQWDSNTGKIEQEYNEHLASVNTATFCEEGKKIVTTADDKKIFIWEFGIGVVVKHIAEPYMHTMPAVTLDPTGKFLACQSMDNQICVYEARGRFRLQPRRRFRGHMSAGYAILPQFSADAAYLTSGDSSGRVWFWDWKTSKVLRTLNAHDGVCLQSNFHPYKESLVATCGWDGLIKLWE